MKKLDNNEYSICRMQGKIFEKSLAKCDASSPIFIRRFMYSTIAKSFDDRSILVSAVDIDEVLDLINDEFGRSSYGKEKYSPNELYWIGYIYRVICFYYNISSRAAFKLVPARKIIDFYEIGHTFDPEDAAERLLSDTNIDEDFTSRGVEILKRFSIFNKLISLIDQNVSVCVDRPIGYKHDGIIYTQNCGYIKEFKALDGKCQDAYILGVNEPIKTFEGKVIAVVSNKNDSEDKLIVCNKNEDYSDEEIKKLINFQEKSYKYKIIR